MESKYLKQLSLENPDVGERYRMKIKVIGNLDPFTIADHELDYTINGVPPIVNMDIIAYLVFSHSFYSQEQLKAFKSLQAYKYFESGFVLKAGTKIVNNFYVLVGKVKHSQSVAAKPLEVWCIIAKNGGVSTAHCTCMAGNSEVCSHVGAMLFAAEYANEKKKSMSCTDIQAVWPMPSSVDVPIKPVHQMYWGKASGCRKKKNEVPPVSSNEMINMLEKMKEMGYSCALMRVVEPFANEVCKKTLTLPSVLQIFQEDNIGKEYSQLIQLSKTIDLSLNEKQITDIEAGTRSQADDPNWYIQRAGRITASKFKSVCKTNQNKPSLSVIKTICYPTKMHFSTNATTWGISHEKMAVEEYMKHMEEEKHDCFIINEVGFIINKKWPQLGASPDRLVYCECCLGGCLEVKCPYLLHTNNIETISDYMNMKSSCLIKKDGEITLNKTHSYYYQVQMQIFVSELLYCDFVIWSPKIFFKTRIWPDSEFWEKESEIATTFHSHVIMPELLGRYFTNKAGTATIIHWCICNGIDDGRPMIKCDADNCEFQWYHFECVSLPETPQYPWYCKKCNCNV